MEKKLSRAEIAAARSIAKTLRVSRRSILYFIRTILLIALVVLACALAFTSAARLSNTYILINEGMTLRAASMLNGGDDPDLAIYFTGDCVRNDAPQRAQCIAPFADYTISSYEYDLSISRMHVYPWQSDVYADVIEQIPSIKATASTESGATGVPAWTPIHYRLHLERIEGRWYICEIELIEVNPVLPPVNTPDPNRSAIPMATPTPEVTPVVVPLS